MTFWVYTLVMSLVFPSCSNAWFPRYRHVPAHTEMPLASLFYTGLSLKQSLSNRFFNPCFSASPMCFPHWFWLSSLKPTSTVCCILNAGMAGWQSPERCVLHFKLLYHRFDMSLVVRQTSVTSTSVLQCFELKQAGKWYLGNCTWWLKSPHQLSSYQEREERRQVQSYRNTTHFF